MKLVNALLYVFKLTWTMGCVSQETLLPSFRTRCQRESNSSTLFRRVHPRDHRLESGEDQRVHIDRQHVGAGFADAIQHLENVPELRDVALSDAESALESLTCPSLSYQFLC